MSVAAAACLAGSSRVEPLDFPGDADARPQLSLDGARHLGVETDRGEQGALGHHRRTQASRCA